MAPGHRSARLLSRGDERFRALFEHAPMGVALCDLDGRFCDVNPALRDLLAGTEVDIDRGDLADLLCHTPAESEEAGQWQQGLDDVREGRRPVARVHLSLAPADAAPRLVQATAARVVLGERAYLLAHIEDATGRRLDQQRLVYLATHDALTGLPNRELVQQRLVAALARASSIHLPVGVLSLDLDHFGQVNERHGQQVGDAALAAVGRRLASVLRAGDSAGRLGEDEFLVVAGDVPDESALAELVKRIEATVSRPIVLGAERTEAADSADSLDSTDGLGGAPSCGGNAPAAAMVGAVVGEVVVEVAVSIGAVLSRPGDQPASMLRRAGAAMFAVKRARRRQARRTTGGPVPPRPRTTGSVLAGRRAAPSLGELALYPQLEIAEHR